MENKHLPDGEKKVLLADLKSDGSDIGNIPTCCISAGSRQSTMWKPTDLKLAETWQEE
jgi:hypothetical protein